MTQKYNGGFTIIELLIATAVFSVILLICAGAMIQIGRVYYKGITSIRTQEAARVIIDDIAQAIQFSGGTVMATPVIPPPDNNPIPSVLCIGSYRYTYVLGAQRKFNPATGQRSHILVKDSFPGCNAGSSPQNLDDSTTFTPTSQDLMPENMRLSKLGIVQYGQLYEITIKVVSGETDILDNTGDASTVNCLSLNFGAQFCALSELQTVVQKRLP